MVNRLLKICMLLFLIISDFLILNKIIVRESVSIKKRLNRLGLEDVNDLMIVAHPDDESLWGGAHLAKGDYLVVCVTCGVVKERQEEFENAMNEFENKYISLGYPDKTNNERDNWAKVYYKIEKDLRTIIYYKDWDIIVTHNPDGEYNHEHHKMTSAIVSKNANKDKLYYFNKYYTKEELSNINYCLKKLNKKELFAKKILLNDYPSQDYIINYDHIQNIPYEKFIPYKYWK